MVSHPKKRRAHLRVSDLTATAISEDPCYALPNIEVITRRMLRCDFFCRVGLPRVQLYLVDNRAVEAPCGPSTMCQYVRRRSQLYQLQVLSYDTERSKGRYALSRYGLSIVSEHTWLNGGVGCSSVM